MSATSELPNMSKTWSKTTNDGVPDSGIGEVVNIDVDDDILRAQGHRPAMKRTFNLLSTLGLGFRRVAPLPMYFLLSMESVK